MNNLEYKQRITQVAIDHLENTIRELRDEVDTKLKGDGNTDEGGFSGNSGDYSAQAANNYLSEQASIRRVEADQLQITVDTLKGFTFKQSHQKVEILSLITTNRGVFFISKAVKPLDVDGKKIFYLATGAPIYEVMAGKQKGDNFSFRNIDYEIQDLY